MDNPKPLVSVVIPTFNRPQFLARAVNSALAGMDSKDIEVIVVPNGPDQSWRKSLAEFKNNPSVRVIPIPESNANIARNTGMANARGEFIRFLDDDDYLYADGAIFQYETLISTKAHVCSASVELMNHDNGKFGIWNQPNTSDFIAGAMSSKRMLQVTAHVYRLDLINNTIWNPALGFSQDIEWMLRLCTATEIDWIKLDIPVGAWHRHIDNRISTSAPLNSRKKIVVENVLSLVSILEQQERLNHERIQAAASGLWECVHAAFFIDPFYWTKIAHIARELAPGSYPDIAMYNYDLIKKMGWHPLIWETLIAPKRFLHYTSKKALYKLRISNKW